MSGCYADYIGCFKPRDNADNRLRLRTHRWYDPHYELFEGDSSRYAEGPFYVIQGGIIDGLVRSGLTVRMGGPNEGLLHAHAYALCGAFQTDPVIVQCLHRPSPRTSAAEVLSFLDSLLVRYQAQAHIVEGRGHNSQSALWAPLKFCVDLMLVAAAQT